MRRFSRLVVASTWIPILVLASCSKNREELPVATVGDRVITVRDYEKAYSSIGVNRLPQTTDLTGRLEFLDVMIDREVLAIKADELGYDKDPSVDEGMEAFKKISLNVSYVKLKVADKFELTEKDIQDTYDMYGTVYHVKQILTDTEEEGYVVYDMLKDGHDFESVCRQYSRGPDAAEGGKTLVASYGQFPPHFQEELFTTPVGGVTKPIINRYGYFVIKVIDAKKAPKPPLSEIRETIERLATRDKQLKLQEEFSKSIRDKYNFQFHDEGLKIVFEAMPPDGDLTNPPSRDLEIYPILKIDIQDLDKPVASYKDEVITVRDFSDLYDRAHFFQRPRREYRLADLRKFIIEIVMNGLIEEELASSEIEKDPDVANMLRRKREDLMVTALHRDLVVDQVQVPWREIEDYYANNRELFYRDERRRFNVILAHDQRSANEARQRILSGEPFNRVAVNYATNQELVQTGLNDVMISREASPEMARYGFSLESIGDVTEPFETEKGWIIAKLVEVDDPGYMSISEASHDIDHRLKQRRNEERLQELLAKWRKEIPIEVFDDNLMKADLSMRPVRGQKS